MFHLHRLYDYAPTIYKSLRPPAEVESLRTNGRKSHKKKKGAEDEGDEDPEAEPHEHVTGEDGETCCKPDPANELVDINGAEVAAPRDPIDKPGKKARTQRKPRAKKGTADADDYAAAAAGEDGKKTPARKPRASKKAQADDATKKEEVEKQVRAEPAEAQNIEDMKMEEVNEPIVEALPCPACEKDGPCAEHPSQ